MAKKNFLLNLLGKLFRFEKRSAVKSAKKFNANRNFLSKKKRK